MEDQDRDCIDDIKGRLKQAGHPLPDKKGASNGEARPKRAGQLLRDKKVFSDGDILGKSLDCFWCEFGEAMDELCRRLSLELVS
jgi:hypothetical protein